MDQAIVYYKKSICEVFCCNFHLGNISTRWDNSYYARKIRTSCLKIITFSDDDKKWKLRDKNLFSSNSNSKSATYMKLKKNMNEKNSKKRLW